LVCYAQVNAPTYGGRLDLGAVELMGSLNQGPGFGEYSILEQSIRVENYSSQAQQKTSKYY